MAGHQMIHLVLKKQVMRGEQEIGKATVAAWQQCQLGYLLPPEASTLLTTEWQRMDLELATNVTLQVKLRHRGEPVLTGGRPIIPILRRWCL